MLNLNNLRTPGVYIDEVSTLPPSVAAVETAIPAFVGFTENAVSGPQRIASFQEFIALFGGPYGGDLNIAVTIADIVVDNFDNANVFQSSSLVTRSISAQASYTPAHNLYYAMKFFYDNGGGDCWVVSAGTYSGLPINDSALSTAIDLLEEEDEPTLIVVPEAIHLNQTAANGVYRTAVDQAANLKDRFVIMDVAQDNAQSITQDVTDFQSSVDVGDHPQYAAAYYPLLETTVDADFAGLENQIIITHTKSLADGSASADPILEFDGLTLQAIQAANNDLLARQIEQAARDMSLILPPSPAIAGIYTRVDNDRGVWKAPANVSVAKVVRPTRKITDALQEDMNIDPNGGNSINAIRAFTGRGILVWGARTLNGNDNEWRYVSVRRFFNFVEESTKKASARFVFEPNDANTWNSIRSMIENFLTIQWKLGALQGAKADDAFFVKVGLGQTMDPQDVLNGRLIVEIGMAVVRPAEFIVLRYMHTLPVS